MSVAKRAQAYPQASAAAGDLVDVAVAAAPAGSTVGAALKLVRKRDARVLAAGERYVLREDLSRASLLGLEDRRASDVARALPCVDARAGEVAVRRLLQAGAPLVVVRDRRGPVGAVAGRPRGEPVAAAAARVARSLPAETRELLETIGRLAAAQGARAFLVGGMVRDVWRETPIERRDLDIVVEGDGLALARRLARDLGGAVLEHHRFLTASVNAPRAGRIDVATARAERYEARGALPRVMPATLEEDLRRRDFTVNAMAIELQSGAFGLHDPLGGRLDLAARRLRVLHPLSYVEDPTRIFRAARYATRLGLTRDPTTARAQALALSLVPYPALSGQRLMAELARVLDEARPAAVLTRLGTAGAFKLLDPRYRFTALTRRHVGELGAALAWARRLAPPPADLAALALVGDQPRRVAAAALARLAFAGEPLARLSRALEEGRGVRAALARAATPSERARLLYPRSPVELGWLWLTGDGPTRAVLDWFAGLEPRLVELSGDDVLALGVLRGPAVARVLAELRDARLDGRLTNRAMEVEHVRHWMRRGG
jgi:tRNA nucleotidyltransferase (CCA-adding enzyme)